MNPSPYSLDYWQNWHAVEGAIYCLALACLLLCVAWYALHHVIRWRRLVRACGSEAIAMATVRLIEADNENRQRGDDWEDSCVP